MCSPFPPSPGKKRRERFPGADQTYTVEAMVQDRKAIQAGTSHFLGQNFSKSQNIGARHPKMLALLETERILGAVSYTHLL